MWLAVAGAGLGGALAWRGAHPADVGPEVAAFEVPLDDVVGIDLPGPVALRRHDGAWWVKADGGELPADADAVAELIGVLRRVRRGLPVEGDPRTFGLVDGPRIRLVTSSGELTLIVGDAAPVGGRTYVRLDDGRVVAVPAPLGSALARPASAWASGDRPASPEAREGGRPTPPGR